MSGARLLVTSASANGDGYGILLAFDHSGSLLGPFSDDTRIADPRGLAVDVEAGLLFLNSGTDRVLALDTDGRIVRDSGQIKGLNPGGGVFGPDGRYYVGLRSARTITAFVPSLDKPNELVFPEDFVPFPRGFGFAQDGRSFLASGIGPDGQGDNTIISIAQDGHILSDRFVQDPELSPLDLLIAPNGNIIVSSEWPFGAINAVTTVREYDPNDGRLLRIFSPSGDVEFRRPRGLRFTPSGRLCCVAQGEVVSFDYEKGVCRGSAVRVPGLHGQALAFF